MNFNTFFIIFISTILITRIFLFFFHIHALKIGKFQMHHYMYGLILIALYFLTSKLFFVAIGTALIVDQIPLLLIFRGFNWPDDCWKQYHSKQSIVGVVAVSLIIYLLYTIN